MICQQCGHKNETDALFCVQCSHPLHHTCPSCGTENSGDARFCKQCGAGLDEESGVTQSTRLKSLQQSAPKGLQQKLKEAEQQIEGQRKPVTIMFADIVGSTSIAEALDPEEWREVVQGAHLRVSEAVHRYEGTIAQLLGDGVLAFFGAPLTHEDDPERAVRAAMDLMESIGDYQRELSGFIDDFQMRVGIHTGEVVVGPVGSDERTEYLAIGDVVNIAARLEAAAQPGSVLVSEACGKFIDHVIELGDFEPTKAKGKKEPIPAAVVLGLKVEPGLARGFGGLRTPFVGRETELRQLQDALLVLTQGQGRIITIVGEAGIGKTRLLERSRELITENQLPDPEKHFDPTAYRWLEGRALSYGGSLSYWMINQLLLHDLGMSNASVQVKVKAGLRKRAVELFGETQAERSLPFLMHFLGLSAEDPEKDPISSLDGESIKIQTNIYLREYFEQAARQKPTVVILEDLHWADPSSLETLGQLFTLSDLVPLTFVLVLRKDPDHASWDLVLSLQKELPHRVTEIHLRRLGSRESQLLVEQLLQPDVLPDTIRELVLQRAEGNPFFLEEVVRHLLDNELLYEEESRWVVSERIEEIGLPDTLQGLILARIDRLEDQVRVTLQIASVIGKSFLFKLLQAISEAEVELNAHLTQLQRIDLVREKSRLPELEYTFKHSLTQEAAYNSLLLERRRSFHLRVAEAIEQLFPDRLDEFAGLLAHHFSAANVVEKAAEYLLRAGEIARSKFSLEETATFFQRAMEKYQQLEDQRMVGKLQTLLGYSAWERGDRQTSLDWLHQALETLEGAGNPEELAVTLAHLSRIHMLGSEYDQALIWGEKALELARGLEVHETIAHTLNTIGSALCGKGELERGLSLLSESLDLALEYDLRDPIFRGYFNRGEYYFTVGRYEEAFNDYQAYLYYARDIEDRFSEALARSHNAIVNWHMGKWSYALEIFDKYENILAGIWQIWEEMARGMILNDLGQSEIACQKLEKSLAIALRSEEIQTTVPYTGQLARAYASLGKSDDALKMIKRSLDLIDSNPFFNSASIPTLLFCCRWFAERDDLENGRRCVTRLEALQEQYPYLEAAASIAEAKGYIASHGTDSSQTVSYFQAAYEAWKTLGRPYDQARVLGYLGDAFADNNEPTESQDSYKTAIEIIDSLAGQLEDPEMKQSFRKSQMVSEIRDAWEAIKGN